MSSRHPTGQNGITIWAAAAIGAIALMGLAACAPDETDYELAAPLRPTSTTDAVVTAPTTTMPSPVTTVAADGTIAAAEADPARSRLVINGVGDTNVDSSYIPALAVEGYDIAFSGLQDLFNSDDLTVVNLECAASDLGAPLPKTFTFNCDLDALPVMAAAGVDVANLANNHGGDYGEEALLDTRANVAAAGMVPVGVGADATEAARPAIFERNGWTIAVVGFGGVVPSAGWIATDDSPGMADGDTIETMVSTVEAADAVADLVVVTIHWGVELDTTPRPDDVARAEAMVDAGADVIFGHHAHRLQPLEFVDDRPVAWGLGNFVWPRLSPAGATSAIAQVVVEPDGTIDACLIPVDIERHGHPVVQVDVTGPCEWTDRADTGPRAPAIERFG